MRKCCIMFTTAAVLLALLLFPGCSSGCLSGCASGCWGETTHVVQNARLSEEDLTNGYPKPVSHLDAYSLNKTWAEEAGSETDKGWHYMAFCGHKKSSVSYWSEEGTVAYTKTEMVIDTVLDSTGNFADNYAEQKTITLIERYAVSPKNKIAFSALVVEGAPFTLAFSSLTESCDIIDNESQYIVLVSDRISASGKRDTVIVCKGSGEHVIDDGNMDSVFIAQLIRKVDTSFAETAGQVEAYTDVEKRNPGSYEQMWDCIYYDLMKMLEEKQ